MLDFRRGAVSDLPVLRKTFGQEFFFEDRLQMQRRHEGELLTAWIDDAPVGIVFLWYAVAKEPEIRSHLPRVPLINHLEVAEDLRDQGIGTKIMAAAEAILRREGHPRVALGVWIGNPRARSLYERLGYRRWEHGRIYAHQDHTCSGTEPEEIDVFCKDLIAAEVSAEKAFAGAFAE